MAFCWRQMEKRLRLILRVYKSWKREGDKLIMDIESIGNGQTIASTDTMNVLKLDKDSLILNNGGMIMRYHRVQE